MTESRIDWQRRADVLIRGLEQDLGIKARTVHVLQRRNRFVAHLAGADVVAIARPASDHAHHEVRLATELATRGARVVPPSPLAGPHVLDGLSITLWSYVAPASDVEASPRDAAEALRALHAHLEMVDTDGPPSYIDAVNVALDILERAQSTMPDLDPAEARFLLDELRRARDGLPTGYERALHGEPFVHNLHPTLDGWTWLDFEAVCVGPIEWEMAALPRDALVAYRPPDAGLESHLRHTRLLVSLAHCWTGTARDPDAIWAGDHLLRALRR